MPYRSTGDDRSVLNCLMPEGHVCEKCAHATQGGHYVKNRIGLYNT